MTRRQISFYATPADIRSILRVVESLETLQFIRAGLFDAPEIVALPSLAASADLGVAPGGDANHEKRYLVARSHCKVEVRSVPQRRGTPKYAIDQLLNPAAVILAPGGIYGDAAVIIGEVGTSSDDASSVELFQAFSNEIRRQFGKVQSCFVGIEANQLMNKGWRLTRSIKYPSEYDLRDNRRRSQK